MYYNIQKKLYSQPWCITAVTHKSICEQLKYYIENGNPMFSPDDKEENKVDASTGTTAVIPVFGIIGKHLSLMETECGAVDVDGIKASIATAISNPDITKVVLWINSPGGTATGVEELSDWIGEQTKVKDIFAYTDGQMCSAAYWIASQCTAVYASPSSEVGSVGVYLLLTDNSRQLEIEGVKVNPIFKGTNKLSGAPFKPLSDEERALYQADVDRIYNRFTEAVLSKRTIKTDYLQGWTYDGEQSTNLGFTDGVYNSIEEMISSLETFSIEIKNPNIFIGKTMTLNIFKLQNLYKELEADRNDIITKCQGLENEVSNLLNMSKDITEELAKLKSEKETQVTLHNDVVAKIKADNEKAIADIKSEYEAKIEQLQNVLKAESNTMETKAQRIVSEMVGVPIAELPQVSNMEVSPEALFNKWQQLVKTNSKEAEAMYKQHSEVFKGIVGYRH